MKASVAIANDHASLCKLLRANDPELVELRLGEPSVFWYLPAFDLLKEAMQRNSTVKRVFILELVVQKSDESVLCLLLETLGSLKSLEAVEVSIPRVNARRRITGTSLASLLVRARNLQSLILWPFLHLRDRRDIEDLSTAVREHPSLRQLACLHILVSSSCSIDPILDSLATVPNLRLLQLAGAFLFGPRTPTRSTPVVQNDLLLSKLLESLCDRLEGLALRNLGLTDAHCKAIVGGLSLRPKQTESRSRVRDVDLHFNSVTIRGFQMILDALVENRNFSLRSVDLFVDDPQYAELRQQMDLFLKLNHVGRIKMNDIGATKEECRIVLVNARDDLDALYFLIRHHPTAL